MRKGSGFFYRIGKNGILVGNGYVLRDCQKRYYFTALVAQLLVDVATLVSACMTLVFSPGKNQS